MIKKGKHVEASIRQRLLNLSRERGEDFQLILTRFGLERLLYRLGKSEYTDNFVLKGAMLFALWTDKVHRPTRDLDLLGYGDNSSEEVKTIFQRLCRVKVEPDGIDLFPDSILVEDIRETQEYQGQRVKIKGVLGQAQFTLQIDIAFGDVIVPEARVVEYPTLLELPQPRIRSYPKETVVSEKFQTVVAFGMSNSRMKDFYDLWIISKQFSFDGEILVRSLRATFERRKTAIPLAMPLVFSEGFTSDRNKSTQWQAFLNRTGLSDNGKGLAGVVGELRAFLEPPLKAAAGSRSFKSIWRGDGRWQDQ